MTCPTTILRRSVHFIGFLVVVGLETTFPNGSRAQAEYYGNHAPNPCGYLIRDCTHLYASLQQQTPGSHGSYLLHPDAASASEVCTQTGRFERRPLEQAFSWQRQVRSLQEATHIKKIDFIQAVELGVQQLRLLRFFGCITGVVKNL